MSLLVTVPAGDLIEVLLALILTLVQLSILAGFFLSPGSIRACGRDTFQVNISLFPFAFLAMPILLLLLPDLLGGLLGLRLPAGFCCRGAAFVFSEHCSLESLSVSFSGRFSLG